MAAVPVASLASGAQAQDKTDPVPTVTLSKTYHPRNPDPAPGEEITYTVTLANGSMADATGYLVDGTLPPEVVNATWTCSATGAGSACGAATGVGHIVDTADVGAQGTVVYVLTGTIAPDTDGHFTQAVRLVAGPGQACEPAADAGRAEQDSQDPGGYRPAPSPPAEVMTCRVNNQVTPSVGATTQDGAAPTLNARPAKALAETGPPRIGVVVGGVSLIALGATLLWLVRHPLRPDPGRHPRA